MHTASRSLVRRSAFVVVLVLAGVASASVPAPPSPPVVDPPLGSPRLAATLDPARGLAVADLRLTIGAATLVLEQGMLFPAHPSQGTPLEFVFVGKGRLLAAPADPIEAGQLEIFTGAATLDEPVTRAVLVIGSPEISAELSAAPAGPLAAGRSGAEAVTMFREWAGRDQRRAFDADLALHAALAGDPRAQRYLGAWLHSERRGELYAAFRPGDPEPARLGRLELVERPDPDPDASPRERPEEDTSRGKALREVERWLSFRPPGDLAIPIPEPQHYALDITLRPEERELEGTARLRLVGGAADQRVLNLSLARSLAVTEVTDGAGTPLASYRSGGDLQVVLPGPRGQGEIEIVVRYRGKAFRRWTHGVYALSATDGWYPRTGLVDRAVYEATFAWPADLELFVPGELLERSAASDGQRARMTLPIPAHGFTFEVGQFNVTRERVGHIDLTVGFSRIGGIDPAVGRQIIDTVKAAVLFFETQLGWIELDRLTVLTVPRGFSQGHLGLITFQHELTQQGITFEALMLGVENRSSEEVRLEILAHEIAHQWWGNKMGWSSERDQWLSEALADYSALQFMAAIAPQRPVHLSRHAQRWRQTLLRRTPQGRTLESLGPVVLGTRLALSHSLSAYQAIVYEKGSVVFGMLAQRLGPERMLQALRQILDEVGHGSIDTAQFLAHLEQAHGASLAAFAGQYVYGTGIPEIFYDHTFVEDPGGGWTIEGHAVRTAGRAFRYRVLRDGQGWNLRREAIQDSSDLPLDVPFQVALAGADTGTGLERGVGGVLRMQGRETTFSIPVPAEPRALSFDQRGVVLATFFDTASRPKLGWLARADQRASGGEAEQAEQAYRRSLEAPAFAAGSLPRDATPADVAYQGRREDARARLGLARILLEQGRVDESAVELESVRRTFEGDETVERWRLIVLEARSELQRGAWRDAYQRLEDYRRRRGPQFERSVARARGEWIVEDAEAAALLAIALFEIGGQDQARAAVDAAEQAGVEMSALRLAMTERRDAK